MKILVIVVLVALVQCRRHRDRHRHRQVSREFYTLKVLFKINIKARDN